MPDEDFEEYVAQTQGSRTELTAAGLLRIARQIVAEVTLPPEDDLPETPRIVGDVRTLIKEGATFRCLYADPQWRFDNHGTRGSTNNHYPTMIVAEICRLPVEKRPRWSVGGVSCTFSGICDTDGALIAPF